MKTYLIYNYKTGYIFRHISWYKRDEKGNITAGTDNSPTFYYPVNVFPAIFQISKEKFEQIKDNYYDYKIINHKLIKKTQ